MSHPTKTLVRSRSEAGMNTAEYAVGTVASCGFATLLYQLLTSDWAADLLKEVINNVIGLLPF